MLCISFLLFLRNVVGLLHERGIDVSLIVGVEGAIQHAGATMSNHWICPDRKVDVVWNDAPDTPPPGLFVSFASLKDPGGALGGVLVAASVDAKLFRQRPK